MSDDGYDGGGGMGDDYDYGGGGCVGKRFLASSGALKPFPVSTTSLLYVGLHTIVIATWLNHSCAIARAYPQLLFPCCKSAVISATRTIPMISSHKACPRAKARAKRPRMAPP